MARGHQLIIKAKAGGPSFVSNGQSLLGKMLPDINE
jgi:hypothetical protein